MARSASDATRFTATGPYAESKPAPSTGNITLGGPAPPNETPQQKIARLRMAAAQARSGQESQFDRIVITGRRWADRAHRFTAISLICLTIVCFGTASIATGDMIMHNRRKRSEWLADQQAKAAAALEEARTAAATGTASDQQILLLNRERAAQEAEEAKRNEKGVFASIKESLFGGVAEEEIKGGRLGAAARAARETSEEVKGKARQGLGVVDAVREKVEENQKENTILDQMGVMGSRGGLLDRQAEASVAAIRNTSSSWWSQITGR